MFYRAWDSARQSPYYLDRQSSRLQAELVARRRQVDSQVHSDYDSESRMLAAFSSAGHLLADVANSRERGHNLIEVCESSLN